MIRTAKQLKDKVRNISGSNSNVAQTLIRNYMMERLLERVSLSQYKDNFILKGGMLVASVIGVDLRATMDIDTTIKALPLNEDDSNRIIEEICKVEIDDGVTFKITYVKGIMEDFEYPGIRMMIEGSLDRLRQPIKIDISTDDVITPSAIEYEYKLMFEDRTISLLSYNLETLLAEKTQTILARGLANTRMRDFYDFYEIMSIKGPAIDKKILRDAFVATCKKRETLFDKSESENLLNLIISDNELSSMWQKFKEGNHFVEDLSWETVINFDSGHIKDIL